MSCRWTIGPLLEGVLVYIGILITPIFCAVATGNQVAAYAEVGAQAAETEEVVSGKRRSV